ncbi:cysteine-rich secretory protein LCCL domain-containing 2-like [Engystomops pustulosus]|uniref:cysteine-rich secretory protein LCCL domain-containing 2-like n=1 Tax=Engystomops pustulosus TaxID=76066 RepID=UPI003AFB27E6
MYVLPSVVIAVAIYRIAGAQIESCSLGYAVLVPCSATAKYLSSDTMDVYCPSGCINKNLSLWGTNIYTENTPVCLAAIHAGIISNGGGYIMVQKMPSQENYTGSIRNGLTSLNYGISNTSFTFPNSSIMSTATVTIASTISTTTSITPSTTTSDTKPISTTVTTPTITKSTVPTTTAVTPSTATPSTSLSTTTFLMSSTLTQAITTNSPATTIFAINIGLISCHTYLDMLQGDPLLILCPANCISSYIVWGTDIYSSDSDLCPSAIHAGVMTSKGGYVTVKREPLQLQYVGSYRNGIQTSSCSSTFVLESYRFL